MGNNPSSPKAQKSTEFPGSALLDGATNAMCGSIDTTSQDPSNASVTSSLLAKADALCISSPVNQDKKEPGDLDNDDVRAEDQTMNPTSALFARALVSEVTDNPQTMTPAAMAEREKRLLKAQEAARKKQQQSSSASAARTSASGPKPIGAMGQPNVLGSIAHSIGIEEPAPIGRSTKPTSSVMPPSSIQDNPGQVSTSATPKQSKNSVTIGLSLSRRHTSVGHPDTVTRQTAFDFNELQDRAYKYVSSTDANGWLAGGGERSGGGADPPASPAGMNNNLAPMTTEEKIAAPDTVHIPIIQIDAESPEAIDTIIAALARGEVFIPHMALVPEALSVNGVSPPDLVVRFGCERNEDTPPDDWPNWCLEFMHNQLYEYFAPLGAQWTKRPFQITLARKVRWKTVKHMNRYFAHAERVIDTWRETGPQYLDPQLSYIEGGATPEEVARPHGIYLLRNGVPTNYFAPNFEPPYTTKMTRSLLLNVLGKSWEKNRREWTSEPVQRLVTPTMLMANLCGCADQGGFMANEVTNAAFDDPGVIVSPVNANKETSIDVSITSPDADETVITADLVGTPNRDAKPSSRAVDPVVALSDDLEDEMDLLDAPPDVERHANSEAFSAASSDEDPILNLRSNGSGEAAKPPAKSASRFNRDEPPTPERVRFPSRSPSPTQKQVASSVAASSEATTTVHTNSALLKEFRNGLKKGEDDENISPKSGGVTPRSRRKKRSKEEIEKERARQIAIIAAAQDEREDAPRYDKYTMNMNGAKKAPPAVQRTDSGTSLEYSIDSSVLDSSPMLKKDEEPNALASHPAENLPEGVPTDEALFAVGWAKALDQKSGSFYYFTLDRSKIVWDNPLSPGGADSTSDPEVLPEGAFAI